MGSAWQSLIEFLKPVFGAIKDFLIYMAGKRSATTEIDAAQAKKDAELAKEYVDVALEPRDIGDEPGRLRKGDW